MCYEFAHPCDDELLRTIAIIGGSKYFLLCIGSLNYLFSNDRDAIDKIRGMLFVEKVLLRVMSKEEMVRIFTVADNLKLEKFHGNKDLYDIFISSH